MPRMMLGWSLLPGMSPFRSARRLTHMHAHIDVHRNISHIYARKTDADTDTCAHRLQGGALRGISAEGLGYILPLMRLIRCAARCRHILTCADACPRKVVDFYCLSAAAGTIFARNYSFSQIDNSEAALSTPSHSRVDTRLRLELVSGYRQESSFVSSLLRADRALLVRLVRVHLSASFRRHLLLCRRHCGIGLDDALTTIQIQVRQV